MEIATIATLAGIFVLLVLSAFFSGSETALTAASRPRMHQLERKGEYRAGIVNRLRDRRDRMIGAILLGNNLVNILASALATSLFIAAVGEAVSVANPRAGGGHRGRRCLGPGHCSGETAWVSCEALH